MSIIKGLSWTAFGQIAKQLLNVITSIILMRLLQPSDFGLLAMVTVITGLSSILLDFGIGVSIIQNKKLNSLDYSSIFWFNISLGIVLMILVWQSGKFLADFYNEPSLLNIATILSFNYLLSSTFLVHRSLLMKDMDFEKIAKIEISTVLIASLLGITLAYWDFGVFSLVLKELSAVFILTVFFWISSKWKPHLHFSLNDIKKILGLSSSMFFNSIYTYFTNNVGKVIIGKFFGKNELGSYSSMLNYTLLPVKSIAKIFSLVLFPAYANMQESKKKIADIHIELQVLSTIIFLPVFAIVAMNGEFLVSFILGKQWEEATPFFKLFSVMSIAVLINSFTGAFLQGLGRQDLIIKDAIFKKSIILIGVLLGSIWGVFAIAIGRVASEFLNVIYSFFQAEKAIKLSWSHQFFSIGKIVCYFIPSVLMHYFIFSIIYSGWNLFLISTCSSYFLFFILIYIFQRKSLIRLKDIFLMFKSMVK